MVLERELLGLCAKREIAAPNSFRAFGMIFVAICCLFSHIRFGRIKSMYLIVDRYTAAGSKAGKALAVARKNFILGYDEFVTRRVVFLR